MIRHRIKSHRRFRAGDLTTKTQRTQRERTDKGNKKQGSWADMTAAKKIGLLVSSVFFSLLCVLWVSVVKSLESFA